MELELFDFELPPERIAQQPLADRSAARLLRLDRATGVAEHRTIRDLPRILRPGDLLVLNDTAVVPAKLSLRRPTGGRVGGLFLRELECRAAAPGVGPRWLVLLNSKGRLREGDRLVADGRDEPPMSLVIERHDQAGQWEVRVEPPDGATDTMTILSRIGQTPLPPYIRRERACPADRERYQTVFARQPGAVAAPTAGLHFTAELLAELDAAGIERTHVTLHVGLGTFQPVKSPTIELHRMHSEWFDCPAATADAANRAKSAGRRVVAVGTTSVRVLESSALNGRVEPRAGWTDLFVFPGYRFAAVDAMLTNFHLPRSSLLVLAAAFAGRERLLAAYREAITREYRFYSYGDAMLIE